MSHLKQRLSLFRIQAFRRYALGCVVAMLGNGLGYVAMTWMVLQIKNSVDAVAMVMFSFWLPSVLLGPFSGVLADRLPRKKLFVIVNALRGFVLIAFGIFEYIHPSLQALYVLSLLQGMIFSLVLPVLVSLIREIVDESKLLMANATIDIAYEVGNVLGMASAGFAIAYLSMSGALIFDGALFLVSALLASGMKVEKPSVGMKRSLHVKAVWKDLLEGLHYIRIRRPLMIIYTIQLLIMVSFMTVPILAAPFSSNILHANVSQFGLIEASLSFGVITGGLFVPWIAERTGLLRLISFLMVVLGISFYGFGLNRHIEVAQALNFVIGFALAVWPLIMTQAQSLTQLSYQGRVQASFNALSGLMILIVYSLVDFGSHYLLLPHLYWVEIGFMSIGICLLMFYQRLIKKEAVNPFSRQS